MEVGAQLTEIDNIAVFKFLHYLVCVMFQTTKKFTDRSIGFTSSLEIPPPCMKIREWTETEKNDYVSQVHEILILILEACMSRLWGVRSKTLLEPSRTSLHCV